jgi:hypothetical protein
MIAPSRNLWWYWASAIKRRYGRRVAWLARPRTAVAHQAWRGHAFWRVVNWTWASAIHALIQFGSRNSKNSVNVRSESFVVQPARTVVNPPLSRGAAIRDNHCLVTTMFHYSALRSFRLKTSLMLFHGLRELRSADTQLLRIRRSIEEVNRTILAHHVVRLESNPTPAIRITRHAIGEFPIEASKIGRSSLEASLREPAESAAKTLPPAVARDLNVDRLAEQVIDRIDRRLIAFRERMGRT